MAKGFTALTIKNLKTPGYHRDRGDGASRGLYLQVRKAEAGGVTRSWLYRYTSPITRKERWMGLGPVDVIPLAEARELARAARRLVTLGTDPIERRRETTEVERAAIIRDKASRMTFRQCADAYLDAHMGKLDSATHRHQWRQSLALASTAFGDVAVAEINDAAVIKFLEPIIRKTHNTALCHRQRVETVLDWATVHKFRQGANPARWEKHLEHVFPGKPRAEPHKAMPWKEVPGFLVGLRDRNGVTGLALEFTILTAARRGEALDARWNEIDLDKRLWTIPGNRMKAKIKHEVPLSDRALEILKALPRIGDYIFTKDGGKRIGNTSMLKLLVRMHAGCSLHGFRSSCRDWAGETTNHDRESIEFSLAHKLPDAVEAAYRRGKSMPKRRLLMQQWASFCAGVEAGDNVVPIRA
jgi:integrase